MAGLIGLSQAGIEIPILRQIVGFILITVVPGFLLLRLLKFNRLGIVETILYSAGLSVAFVMFLGLIINILLPLIGISRPISLLPFSITLILAILIMCAVIYLRERKESRAPPPDTAFRWPDLISPPVLWLLLLPLISVLGVFLVYLHHGNLVLLILLSFIAITAVLVGFNKFIPAKLYPLAVFSISLSLVWQITLVSPSLAGYDIHYHYYLQDLIISNGVWDASLGTMSNSMLSIVMLAPFNSLLLNMDGVWVFKIIFPLLFALVPLALFQVFRKQTDERIAFFGAFFFVSFPSFFFTIPFTATQMIAELFLALLILTLIDIQLVATKRALLLIVFSFALVVSHYATSYIYLLYLLLVIPFMLLWGSHTAETLWGKLAAGLSRFKKGGGIARWSFKPAEASNQDRQLRANYVMLFFVFCIAWYMYAASGYTVEAIVNIGEKVYNHITTDFFALEMRDPQILQALGQASMRGGEASWEAARYFQYFTQIFIIAGVAGLVAGLRKTKFHPVYIALTLASVVIILLCIILPYFASALNMDRIYQINLFFLAPFCVLGGIAVVRWLYNLLTLRRLRVIATSSALSLVVILVLAPYFLFSSGFIFDIAGSTPSSTSLALYKSDRSVFTQPEINAARWLGEAEGASKRTYGDAYGETQLGVYDIDGPIRIPEGLDSIVDSSYIFLRQWNVQHNEILFFTGKGVEVNMTYIDLNSESCQDMFNGRSLIYDNGHAQIFGYK